MRLPRSLSKIELIVIVIAFLGAFYSQSWALLNRYVVNNDVTQNIYWMQQFKDGGLFRDDLLTEFAQNFQPWGFTLFYRFFSLWMHPYHLSKILPILLLAVSALFIFRLVSTFADEFAGFFAASVFVLTPMYITRMAGGQARAFGIPLLILFLHHFIKKSYLISSMVLFLQSQFYPIVFLPSFLAFALSFVTIKNRRLALNAEKKKLVFFLTTALLCSTLLGLKYYEFRNPAIGSIVVKKDMINKPEYYQEGRHQILPVTPVSYVVVRQIYHGCYLLDQANKFLHRLRIPTFRSLLVLVFLGIFFLVKIWNRKLMIPPELYSVALSGILLYWLSDRLLLRLYMPDRYIEYTIAPVILIISGGAIGHSISNIRIVTLRKGVQFAAVVFFCASFGLIKDAGLEDFSRYRGLYERTSVLSKAAMVAAHPYLADGIPTFSFRKVFVNYELSHPWYDTYWETIKARTIDFFNAYYAENLDSVSAFFRKYRIDWLILCRDHYSPEYLKKKKIYFEPFNSQILDSLRGRKKFILFDVFLKNSDEEYVLINKKDLSTAKSNL